jgi:hypothetical protein
MVITLLDIELINLMSETILVLIIASIVVIASFAIAISYKPIDYNRTYNFPERNYTHIERAYDNPFKINRTVANYSECMPHKVNSTLGCLDISRLRGNKNANEWYDYLARIGITWANHS